MGKRSDEKKAKLMALLQEYLKNSNRSDKEIAKALGVSQPTVSKMKKKLLEEGLVMQFSAIPDLVKMGYEIMALSFVKFNTNEVYNFNMKDVMKLKRRAKDWAESSPCIIFDAKAEGMGINAVNISLHKDYMAYQEFLRDSKKKWGTMMAEVQFVLVDLVGGIAKPFSFKYLAEDIKTDKTRPPLEK